MQERSPYAQLSLQALLCPKVKRKFWVASGLALCYWGWGGEVRSQIAPDGSLSTNVTTPDNLNFTINDGGRAGNNLFHSFREFSIPTGGEVFFNNAIDIQNIFSRVTGISISNIDGLIRANGTANLFLINPNGIIFGPNARLNIGGSFLGSTASSIKFGDGLEFSATNPQAAPLLSINVPIGLQFAANSPNPNASIIVQGVGNNLSFDPDTFAIIRDNRPVGLGVLTDRTLALVGGDVKLEGGNLTASSGRIELGSVAPGSFVTVTPTNIGWQLGYEGVQNFQDISLSQAASVDASGIGGGSIQVQGRRISLSDGSAILSLTEGSNPGGSLTLRASESVEMIGGSANGQFTSFLATEVQPKATGNGGNLSIETGRLSVKDRSSISTSTFGKGKAGNITATVKDAMEIIGSRLSTSGDIGDSGNVTLETGRLTLKDGATVFASNSGSEKAGNITLTATDAMEIIGSSLSTKASFRDSGNVTIETGRLTLKNGSTVFAAPSTLTSGKAGNITLTATDAIEIIDSKLYTPGIGYGGNVTIETGRLTLKNGSTVLASTDIKLTATDAIEIIGSELSSSIGGSGNVSIETETLTLKDGARVSASTIKLTATDAIEIIDSTLSNSDYTKYGGNVWIETGRLTLKDGARVSAYNFGSGKAGNIKLTATDAIEIIDSTLSTSGHIGDGGNVSIETERLTLKDRSGIVTSTYGSGKAGNIKLTATDAIEIIDSTLSTSGDIGDGGNVTIETRRLTLKDYAGVLAFTAGSGKAGNIKLTATDAIEIIGSRLYTSGYIGDGGNVTIETERLTLKDRSGIVTSTYGSGKAGNIVVTAKDAIKLIGTSDLFSGGFSIDGRNLGDGGNVTIETGQLTLKDGSTILASTTGSGKAGDLTIKARDSIEVSGTSADDNTVSELGAGSGFFGLVPQPDGSLVNELLAGKGDAGNINIETERLVVRDRARVTVNSFGEAKAGSLTVLADSINLDNAASLNANTKGGGGDINLTAQSLILRDNSTISTNAQGINIPGGNINLNLDNGVIAAFKNSDITANSADFRGGTVTINATGIFGAEFRTREQLLNTIDPAILDPTSDLARQSITNDITATGADSFSSGTVAVNTPDVDPSSGLLPSIDNLVDVTSLVASVCRRPREERGEFIYTGRGGIAPDPFEGLPDKATWLDLRPRLVSQSGRVSDGGNYRSPIANSQLPIPNTQIVEAQGWIVNSKGEVELVAQAPTATPHNSGLSQPQCYAP